MIFSIADESDLKEIIAFVNDLRKNNGEILNFHFDDKDENEKKRLVNPRYLRILLFDYNFKVILAKYENRIVSMYVCSVPSKLLKTTSLLLIHYYGYPKGVPLKIDILTNLLNKQFTKLKVNLAEESDTLAEKLGLNIKETIKYISGRDFVYSLILEEETNEKFN